MDYRTKVDIKDGRIVGSETYAGRRKYKPGQDQQVDRMAAQVQSLVEQIAGATTSVKGRLTFTGRIKIS